VELLKNKARSLWIVLCTELKPEPLTPFSLFSVPDAAQIQLMPNSST
jgi:hypothetical protein